MSIGFSFGLFELFLPDDVKKWWMWGYYLSPLMYGQNAAAVNEFLGQSWRKHVSSRFCAVDTSINTLV